MALSNAHDPLPFHPLSLRVTSRNHLADLRRGDLRGGLPELGHLEGRVGGGHHVAEDPEEAFRTNFLGIQRTQSPVDIAADPRVNRKHLITLIKEDRHFADAYAVLGQLLLTEGPAQRPNAARAFQRAQELAPSPRMREIYAIGAAMAAKNSRHDFEAEREAVRNWQAEYAAHEHRLLGETGPNEIAPLMNVVYQHMTIKRTKAPAYLETETVYRHKPRRSPLYPFLVFVGIVGFGLLLLKGVLRLLLRTSR